MSQPTRVKRTAPARRQNPLPAIISAVVVIAVFVGLGFMLANNRSGTSQTAAVPTLSDFQQQPTSDAAALPTAAAPAAVPTTAAATGASAASDTASRNGMYKTLPPMTIDPKKNYTATITTPRGDIVVKLRPDLAPQTVNSFVFLANQHFYDGLTWHRVLQNFMAQGGDPTGTGTGDAGYNVPDEFTTKVKFDKPGYLAMAHSSQANSGSSQFFITTAAAPWLDGQYTIFGEVEKGQDIANAIPLRDPEQNPTTPGEQIVKVVVTEG